MKINKNRTYTITQIANIAGVSKASVSRWLNKRNVSPDHVKGKAKFFSATYVNRYLEAHRSSDNKAAATPGPVELLQAQVRQLTAENKSLVKRIDKQDEQIRSKDKQIANWTQQSAIVSKLANDSHNMTQKLLEIDNLTKHEGTAKDKKATRKADKPHKSWFRRLFS